MRRGLSVGEFLLGLSIDALRFGLSVEERRLYFSGEWMCRGLSVVELFLGFLSDEGLRRGFLVD